MGDTPTGFFARLEPCRLLQPGDRLGPLNAALMALLDEEYGTGFGPLTPAPSLRRRTWPRRVPRMARVVVIGGGFGGLASAARLAKLGHDVVLVERLPQLGGALSTVEQDGFAWDAGPTTTLLPAVVRDLFRKSGRPLESEVDLVPQEVVRVHHFEDATSVTLPGGSRGAQLRAVDELGAGLGEQWCAYVSTFAEEWDTVRRGYLERPWRRDRADKDTNALLFTREMLAKRVKQRLRDGRLRQMATHVLEIDGHDPRNVPAWLGTTAYLEQNFGAWTVPGGMAAHLAGARRRGWQTRKVSVLPDTEVLDIVVRGGRAVAVATAGAELDADAGGLRGGPAEAAGPGAVRRADDAGDPSHRLPPRARGRRARPGAGDRVARRPDPGAAHRRPGSRGRARVDAAGPRTAVGGHRGGAGAQGCRRTSATWSAGSTGHRASRSSTGTARRWACCGRAAPP